jgi:RHS repeat-associated protein
VAYYEYDAWGNVLTACGSLANEFAFSTKQASTGTGLIDFGYRWYDPQTARWTQRDPLGAWGGLNLYSFVASNPCMFVDRWGLKTGYRLIVLEIVVDDGFVYGDDVDWEKIKRELGSAGRCEVRTDFVEKHEEKDLKHVREDGELFYRIQVHLTDKVKTHVGGGGGGEATIHGGRYGRLYDDIDDLEEEGYNRRHILVCAILHEIGHALDLHHQSDKAVEKYGDSVMHTEGGDMIVPRSENAIFNELDCTLIQRTLKQAGHKLTRLSIKLTRLLLGLYGS